MKKSKLVTLLLVFAAVSVAGGAMLSNDSEKRSRILETFGSNVLAACLALVASEHDDQKPPNGNDDIY